MISTILIIGGGQAGAQAIDTLRREGFDGRLVLIGDEPELPYQRPPLSKKYLWARWRPTAFCSGTEPSTTNIESS